MKNQNSQTNLYTIYDVKSEQYSELICSTEENFEHFLNILVNTHTEMPQHTNPEDFITYKIGTWCDETGFPTIDERKLHTSLAGLRKECKQCKPSQSDTIAAKSAFHTLPTDAKTDYKKEIK